MAPHAGYCVNEILKIQQRRDITESIQRYRDNNEDTLDILLLCCSDDFKPDSSNEKNRNNGMWTLAVSIFKPK